MNLSTVIADLEKIKLPERYLDIVAGCSLVVIFLIGISFQFGYSRHASDYQSLARPHTAPVVPMAEAETTPEDPDSFVPTAL